MTGFEFDKAWGWMTLPSESHRTPKAAIVPMEMECCDGGGFRVDVMVERRNGFGCWRARVTR